MDFIGLRRSFIVLIRKEKEPFKKDSPSTSVFYFIKRNL